MIRPTTDATVACGNAGCHTFECQGSPADRAPADHQLANRPAGDIRCAAISPSTAPIRASIIIVSYNNRTQLLPCLESLSLGLSQDTEIILVDNNSNDGSASDVARNFPYVQVIRNRCNSGFGSGNNLAASQARGTYLAFINPDTIVSTGWLDGLIAALEQDPGAGMATPKILMLSRPDCINACGNEIHCSGLTLCRGAGQDRDAFSQPSEVPAVSGAAFVIRRQLFDLLDGFDTSFFMYMEDTDLSWRAWLAGWRTLYVPESIVWHDYSLRFNAAKVFYQERNRYLMLLKTLRWKTLAILAPTLLLAEFVAWGFVLLRDRHHMGNKIRAYRWIIHHWRLVMSNRRRCCSLRHVADRELLRLTQHSLAFRQVEVTPITRIAANLFDRLFFLLHKMNLAIVRW